MLLADIHPGDRLIVREWDDMAAEFPASTDEVIRCQFSFPKFAIEMCGCSCLVKGIRGDLIDVVFDYDRLNSEFSSFSFPADMFRPESDPYFQGPDVEIDFDEFAKTVFAGFPAV